jgi:hypothetical protein
MGGKFKGAVQLVVVQVKYAITPKSIEVGNEFPSNVTIVFELIFKFIFKSFMTDRHIRHIHTRTHDRRHTLFN